MSAKEIRLDLNYPPFLKNLIDLADQDIRELRTVFRTLRKLQGLDWQSVYRDRGLKWEQIKDQPGKFTIRLSGKSRAVVRREGDYLRFISLHPDHDSAYQRS